LSVFAEVEYKLMITIYAIYEPECGILALVAIVTLQRKAIERKSVFLMVFKITTRFLFPNSGYSRRLMCA
jgi:hypothetical protein